MADHRSDTDETVSYSEEEIEASQVVGDEPDNTENDSAIAAILDENEKLEQQREFDEAAKRAGKQRAPKTSITTDSSIMNVIRQLQDEVKSLKRNKNSPKKGAIKKLRIDTTTSDNGAFDRPRNSKNFENEVPPSASSVKSKQLSSVQKQQSVSAPRSQLSSATIKQLSPVKQSTAHADLDVSDTDDDDEVTIHVDGNQDDPLAREVRQQAGDVQGDDSSEDDDDDEDNQMFEDLVGAIDIGGDDDLLSGLPLQDTWAQKVNLAWKTKLQKTSFNTLMLKYRTPSNLTDFKIPRMNKGIWDLCSRWQRKSDLSMSASQRALVKSVTAVLKMHDYFSNQPRSTRQIAMQTTADIISLLGKVKCDITQKRKVAARPCLPCYGQLVW